MGMVKEWITGFNPLSVVEYAAIYRLARYKVCLIEAGQKLPHYARWGTYSMGPDDFTERHGVGFICGRKNRDLVCIDVDSLEALKLAAGFLPYTGMIDGRPGKPMSHYWYRVKDIPPEYLSTGCQVEG